MCRLLLLEAEKGAFLAFEAPAAAVPEVPLAEFRNCTELNALLAVSRLLLGGATLLRSSRT